MANGTQRTEHINSFYLDQNNTLSIVGVGMMLQEIASIDCGNLKCDYHTLYDNFNMIWVLTKMKIVFHQHPRWNEKVVVKTWPYKPQLIKFERDFKIESKKLGDIAEGYSEWCLLDATTHAIKRARALNTYPTDNFKTKTKQINYFNYNFKLEELEEIYTRKIRYSDVDMNFHTNNIIYYKIALDSFDCEFLKEHIISETEIHYLKESHANEELVIYRKQLDDKSYYILGVNKENQNRIFDFVVKF